MFSPIRIATEKTLWFMPEQQFGFFTDVGTSYFLSHLKDIDLSVGLYLASTGARVKGKDLLKYKLATHYITSDKLELLKAEIQTACHANVTLEELTEVVEKYCESNEDAEEP